MIMSTSLNFRVRHQVYDVMSVSMTFRDIKWMRQCLSFNFLSDLSRQPMHDVKSVPVIFASASA